LYERVINIISSFNRQAPVNVPSEWIESKKWYIRLHSLYRVS
jgi:hypothetical protein